MFRESIFFVWSLFNLGVFALVLFLFLKLIPQIKSKTRIILTVISTILYVAFLGFSFGKRNEIYKRNPEYPYEIIRRDFDFARWTTFSLSGRVEYEIPKSDTLLKPRVRKIESFMKGFTLGYNWDTPYAKGNFNRRKDKKTLLVETHGKLEFYFLGIKIHSRTYSLSEDIVLEDNF